MTNNNFGAPVYAVVANTIRDSIFSGKHNPGDLLSSENELCIQFSASRETVRKSLKILENDGFILSRPGKGYFVSVPQHDRFTVSFSEFDELGQSKLKRINVVEPEQEVRKALELALGARVVKIQRVIYNGSEIVAAEHNYIPYEKGQPIIETSINYAVFPEIAAAKTAPFAFCTRLEIGVGLVDNELSKLLECPEGEPMLIASRHLIGQNGQRIGFGKRYMRRNFGTISGMSGYLPEGHSSQF